MATAALPQQQNVVPNIDTTTSSKQIPIVCPGHTRPLAELQFYQTPAPENRIVLVSACHDKMPMIRDGVTGDWIGTFSGHKGAVWSCRLDTQTCSLAATASGDFSVMVWDAITGKPVGEKYPHKHIVKTCDFSPDSTILATGGQEGILRLFDLQQQFMKQHNNNNNTAAAAAPIEVAMTSSDSNKVMIGKLCWYNTTTVLCGCGDGTIRYITKSNSKWECTKIISTGSKSEIRDMEITHHATPIVSVASGNTVYFYNVDSYECMKQYSFNDIHFRDEGGVSLHPLHGRTFIVGGSDLWVRVYDYDTGAQLDCLKGHHGPIRCLKYSPSGLCFASGSEDGTIRLWATADDTA